MGYGEFNMTLKLFVADDSVTIQKVIGLAFNETDAVIESVTSGEAALDSIRSCRPDIVLADVCMPGVNGYEICAKVKEDPDLSKIPVVLLVGTFEPFDESEASRAGFDASLTKPFDTSELVDIVQKLVGRNTMLTGNEFDYSGASDAVTHAAVQGDAVSNTRMPVSRQSMESFLGSNRILDVFDGDAVVDAERRFKSLPETMQSVNTESAAAPFQPQAVTIDQLSEEALETIVEKVVKKMSADIISEIAWEVVPELSEILIRRSIEEGRKP